MTWTCSVSHWSDLLSHGDPENSGGYPSKYWLDQTLLNFSDSTQELVLQCGRQVFIHTPTFQCRPAFPDRDLLTFNCLHFHLSYTLLLLTLIILQNAITYTPNADIIKSLQGSCWHIHFSYKWIADTKGPPLLCLLSLASYYKPTVLYLTVWSWQHVWSSSLCILLRNILVIYLLIFYLEDNKFIGLMFNEYQ